MSEYKATEKSNYYDDSWFTGTEKDADYELSEFSTLEKLRLTSKKMIKNNFIADGIQEAIINLTLGSGIKIKAKKKKTQIILDKILSAVDKERELSLADIIEQILTVSFADGDCLINMIYTKGVNTEYKTSVEIIEAGRIKTPRHLYKDKSISLGVKKDSQGKTLGYYVRKLVQNINDSKDLGEGKDAFIFLPAYKKGRRVCWLNNYRTKRPDQSRGIPPLTSDLNMLRYFLDYLNVVMIQNRVSTSFSAFIHTSNPAGAKRNMEEQMGSAVENVAKIPAGMIVNLKNSDKVTFGSPTRPSDNTDQYIARMSSLMAMPFRIPYAILFMDLSSINYTSYKAGMVETKRAIGKLQRNLSKTIRRILEFYVEEINIKRLTSKIDSQDLRINYPKIDIIDEEKIARADKINILSNETKSRQDSCLATDTDYDDLQEDLMQEQYDILDRQTNIMIKKKALSEEFGIIYPDTVQEEDRQTSKRTGESEGTDLDEDDAKERRKEDGNW